MEIKGDIFDKWDWLRFYRKDKKYEAKIQDQLEKAVTDYEIPKIGGKKGIIVRFITYIHLNVF